MTTMTLRDKQIDAVSSGISGLLASLDMSFDDLVRSNHDGFTIDTPGEEGVTVRFYRVWFTPDELEVIWEKARGYALKELED